jgi:hypothetical protein
MPIKSSKSSGLTVGWSRLYRDAVARVERELADKPLLIRGLNADARRRLCQRIWYDHDDGRTIHTTMSVLPVAAHEFRRMLGVKSIKLRYSRGVYSLTGW